MKTHLVASIEGIEGVAQLVVSHLSSKLGGQVAAGRVGTIEGAQQSLHHHQREGVLRGPGSTLESQSNVSLLK